VTISSWLNFGRSAPPGRGSVVGWKFLAVPYYSQRAMFSSLWALFSFLPVIYQAVYDVEWCGFANRTKLIATQSNNQINVRRITAKSSYSFFYLVTVLLFIFMMLLYAESVSKHCVDPVCWYEWMSGCTCRLYVCNSSSQFILIQIMLKFEKGSTSCFSCAGQRLTRKWKCHGTENTHAKFNHHAVKN